MRLAYYAGASTAAAAACLLKAFHSRPNFYSATVYLSQSNACVLILTNLCLMLACSFIYGLQRLLYGPLRPIEIEQLSEKAWYAVLDTLLAMPSFREDVGGWLLTMFVLLLAGKVWGWIGEGRVDILEQGQPMAGGGSTRLFHARLATSLVLSVVFDVAMLNYCVESVMADPRPGMMVIFTFEFAILSIFSMFTLSRYCLSLIQARIEEKQMKEAIAARKSEIQAERAAARQIETADGQPAPASPPNDEPIEVDENEVDVPGWEEKRRYLFALEVFTDFIKLMIYIVFFTVSVTFNGLPMHIMRDVYMTFASFSKRVSDYVAYRKATSDMNTRYPDATTEEIRGDACIVCRESMVAWDQPPAANADQAQPAGQQPAAAPTAPQARRDEGLRAKKLPCNHILHLRCLKAWLERQQVCPTCRRPVVQPTEAASAQPGAPGAPGAPNAALPGQPGQNGARPPQRQNRARFFNFGPLRVGFLNGPDDQIQNIINRMRNPQAAANQDAAQAAAMNAQGGPNHLGLQVPYANGGGVPTGGQQGGARAQVPTQIQMLQLEHRLLQEAHNLGVEQQQLGMLRMMEAEMARLRAQYLPAQPPVGTLSAVQRQAQQAPMAGGLFGGVPFQQQQQPLFMPAPHPQQQEVLQGNAGQQIAGGHESLPQGLVLPEGWTVMPLQRAGGAPTANSQSAEQSASHSEQPPIQTTTNGPIAHASDTPSQEPISVAAAQAPQQSFGGPTDDRGSPLFVPATAASADETTSAPPQDASRAPQPTPTQASPEAQPAQQQSESKAPWTAQDGNGWSFVNQNGDSASNGEHGDGNPTEQQPPADGRPTEEQQGYSGKGKGKAVEVEDAPEEHL